MDVIHFFIAFTVFTKCHSIYYSVYLKTYYELIDKYEKLLLLGDAHYHGCFSDVHYVCLYKCFSII